MRIKLLLSLLTLSLISVATSSVAVAQQYKEDYILKTNAHQRNSSAPNIDMIYGASMGLIFPHLSVEGKSANIDSKTGFKAGIMWGVDWGMVEFVPELWYSTFKMDFKDSDNPSRNGEISNKSIDIPLILSLNVWETLRVNLGPTFSLKCDNNFTPTIGDDFDFGHIKKGAGFVGGLSATFWEHMLVDVRYTGRFSSNTNEWNDGGDKYNIKCYDISMSVGYRF